MSLYFRRLDGERPFPLDRTTIGQLAIGAGYVMVAPSRQPLQRGSGESMSDDTGERPARIEIETKLDIALACGSDHETRLRTVERGQWVFGGAAIIISAAATYVVKKLGLGQPDHARCHLPYAAARPPPQGLLQPSPETPRLGAPEDFAPPPLPPFVVRLRPGQAPQTPRRRHDPDANRRDHSIRELPPAGSAEPHRLARDVQFPTPVLTVGTMIDRYTYTERAVKPLSLKLNPIWWLKNDDEQKLDDGAAAVAAPAGVPTCSGCRTATTR
jgi:hypothetical protein